METLEIVAGVSGLLYLLATTAMLALVGAGISVSIAHAFVQLHERLQARQGGRIC